MADETDSWEGRGDGLNSKQHRGHCDTCVYGILTLTRLSIVEVTGTSIWIPSRCTQ